MKILRSLRWVLLPVVALAVGFVVHHRLDLRWPDSGAAVRREWRPARVLETVERPASVATLLEIHDAAGPITTAWLRVPRELQADYEVLITYVGHATGRKLLDLVPERPDVVLVAMQYSGEYRRETWSDKLALPRVLRETTHDTVAGGMLAVEELERRGFERQRLTILGVSVGTFFAVLHGAYDEAPPRVLIVHGGGDLRRVLGSIYTHRGRPWTGRLVGSLAWLFLDPVDPIHHVGKIAPRSFAMIASRGDTSFPEESASLLYAEAGAPKAIAWTAGDHVRSKRPDIIAELVESIDAYLQGNLDFDERVGEPVERPSGRAEPVVEGGSQTPASEPRRTP